MLGKPCGWLELRANPRGLAPLEYSREAGVPWVSMLNELSGRNRLGSWQSAVETTVSGMGYEVVDAELVAGGLLRVYIDRPEGIRMEDCELVSRQLSHALAVDDFDYRRLEVSSPGLDRPLKKAEDFVRFAGCEVAIKLKRPLEGRRHFEGVLEVEEGGQFGLILVEEQATGRKTHGAPAKPGAAKRVAPKAPADEKKARKGSDGVAPAARKLVFALDEIDRARLVPKVAF